MSLPQPPSSPPATAPDHAPGPFAGAHDALIVDLRRFLSVLGELRSLLDRVPPAAAASRGLSWAGPARVSADLALEVIEAGVRTISDVERTASEEYGRALSIVEALR